MLKPLVASSNFAELAVFGLVLFISIFVLVVLRTWVFKSKRDFDAVAAMPLADEHQTRGTSGK